MVGMVDPGCWVTVACGCCICCKPRIRYFAATTHTGQYTNIPRLQPHGDAVQPRVLDWGPTPTALVCPLDGAHCAPLPIHSRIAALDKRSVTICMRVSHPCYVVYSPTRQLHQRKPGQHAHRWDVHSRTAGTVALLHKG